MADDDDNPWPPGKKRGIEGWADKDRTPMLPNPGQAMVQKKGKKD